MRSSSEELLTRALLVIMFLHGYVNVNVSKCKNTVLCWRMVVEIIKVQLSFAHRYAAWSISKKGAFRLRIRLASLPFFRWSLTYTFLHPLSRPFSPTVNNQWSDCINPSTFQTAALIDESFFWKGYSSGLTLTGKQTTTTMLLQFTDTFATTARTAQVLPLVTFAVSVRPHERGRLSQKRLRHKGRGWARVGFHRIKPSKYS